MTALEYRGTASRVEAFDENARTFETRVVAYGVADSYGSVWEPGVFAESLRSKPTPPAAWAHDWARIIGSVVETDERSDGLHAVVKLADFDAVPDARMAYSLLKDGHVRDTSFGFKRQDWTDTRGAEGALEGEVERLRVARLDEVSPVLVGAVPGAGVTAVRSEGQLSRVSAADIVTKLAAGVIDLRSALGMLDAVDPEPETRVDETPDVELRSADLAFVASMLEDDLGFRVVTSAEGAKGTAQLKTYWAKGEGAAKIKWGTEGDHTRCVKLLSKYVPPNQVHGLCTNIEKLARGGKVG